MISVCIIMKNEEKNIEECLKRIKPFGFEIVVVDTGSTDKSKEIALKYTDKVFDFKWIDDFSSARNFASEMAQNDFIFALDCDEFIEEIDLKEIEELIEKNKDSILCPTIINLIERNGEGLREYEKVSRIYSKSVYHYVGKIHEQLARIDGKDSDYIDINSSFLHVGYLGNDEQKFKKAQRNVDLLQKQLDENGDDPYIYYQLGKAFFMQKKYKDAIRGFEKCLELEPNLKLEYMGDNILSLCHCLINDKQYESALRVCQKYDKAYSNSADFQFVCGLAYMNNSKFSDAVIKFLTASQCDKVKVEGTNSYSAFYNIGVIFECCNQKETALEYYEKCGDFKPALDGIKRINK